MYQEVLFSNHSYFQQTKKFLPALPPFDFKQSLHFIEGFTPTKGEQTLTESKVSKALSLKNQALLFTVEAVEDKNLPGVNYTLFSTDLDETLVQMAERAISDYLGLQDDLSELYRVGENDPAFAPVLKKLYGYHQVRFLTPFENAVWAILSQRVPMNVASKIKLQFAERYGPTLEIPDSSGKMVKYTAFPEPEVIAALNPADLSEFLGNSRKSEYLLAVAEAFSTILRPAEVGELSREELKDRLLSIKGIGPWSAEFILIRGFGRMGGLPEGEKRHTEIVSRLYNNGRPVTQADIERFAAPYGSAKGYWAHYLRVADWEALG
jgi:DNA-3-methyladenine glycosylase II